MARTVSTSGASGSARGREAKRGLRGRLAAEAAAEIGQLAGVAARAVVEGNDLVLWK